MICKSCGTEIADKALICYRCGAPTSGTIRPAPAGRRPAARWVSGLGLLALVVAALFLGRAGDIRVPPPVSYGVAVLALVVLGWRVYRRRRQRRR